MPLEKKPFVNYEVGEKNKEKNKEITSLKLNDEYKEIIKESKFILNQSKTGTVIKQLIKIGYKSITKPESRALIETVFENKRKNKRNNINDFE